MSFVAQVSEGRLISIVHSLADAFDLEAQNFNSEQDRTHLCVRIGHAVSLIMILPKTCCPPCMTWTRSAESYRDIIVSILRIVYLLRTSYSPGSDFTWASTGTYTWSVIEPSLGVIVACSAVLRPLVNQCFPNFRSSAHSGSGGRSWRDFRPFKGPYSDISNTDISLQRLGTFNSTAVGGGDPHHEGSSDTVKAESTIPMPEATHQPTLKDHVIRVQNEVSVNTRPKDTLPLAGTSELSQKQPVIGATDARSSL